MATVFHETIARFEETVGRVTEITVLRTGRADRDLVIALQDFDRLQQEFVTLREILAWVAATPDDAWPGAADADQPGHEAIAAISVADLKERLVRELKDVAAESTTSQAPDEMVF